MDNFYEMVCFDRLYAPAKGTKLKLNSPHFLKREVLHVYDDEEDFYEHGIEFSNWEFCGTIGEFRQAVALGKIPSDWWWYVWVYDPRDPLYMNPLTYPADGKELHFDENLLCEGPSSNWLAERPRIFVDKHGVVLDVVFPGQDLRNKVRKLWEKCLAN